MVNVSNIWVHLEAGEDRGLMSVHDELLDLEELSTVHVQEL